jgi:hypothetical protein
MSLDKAQLENKGDETLGDLTATADRSDLADQSVRDKSTNVEQIEENCILIEGPGMNSAQHSTSKLKKKEKVKDYKWLYYDISEEKEIDYIGDFLYLTRGKKLNKIRLGLHDEAKKKINPSEETGNVDLNMNINSSSKKVMDVANNLMERLIKFGRLDAPRNIVTRHHNSQLNAYIYDDFIEDPDEAVKVEELVQFDAKYEDFFVVDGDLR